EGPPELLTHAREEAIGAARDVLHHEHRAGRCVDARLQRPIRSGGEARAQRLVAFHDARERPLERVDVQLSTQPEGGGEVADRARGGGAREEEEALLTEGGAPRRVGSQRRERGAVRGPRGGEKGEDGGTLVTEAAQQGGRERARRRAVTQPVTLRPHV